VLRHSRSDGRTLGAVNFNFDPSVEFIKL
jgi:hypothetical protein